MRIRSAWTAFLIVGMASSMIALGRAAPAVRATGWVVAFFDDFTTNTGWNVSESGDAPPASYCPSDLNGNQWPGVALFGYNDGGVSVLRLAQDGGVTFPLVGREGLFNGLPPNARWAFEIRFRFPEVTDYGVNIGMGSGAWNAARQAEDQPVRTDWGDAFAVHQGTVSDPNAPDYQGRLKIYVFDQQIYSATAPNTAWHTVRVEVNPDNSWTAYVDGAPAGSGAGAFRPNLVYFGNYYEQCWWGNWTDLHI
ncbi:MAG: hypothetical protein ACK4OK_00615, partial [Thermoflexus sp.]